MLFYHTQQSGAFNVPFGRYDRPLSNTSNFNDYTKDDINELINLLKSE